MDMLLAHQRQFRTASVLVEEAEGLVSWKACEKRVLSKPNALVCCARDPGFRAGCTRTVSEGRDYPEE